MSEQKKLRIHAQITPEISNPVSSESEPSRQKSTLHRFKRRDNASKTGHREKQKLTFGDRLLRNSALACALLLAILAMGNLNHPWAIQASETIERALTMHIDLDDSIGQLSFVRNLMPESALVFLDLSGHAEFKTPVPGKLSHAYSEMQPWLMFSCPAGSVVQSASDGTVTAVAQLSDGEIGVLIDHGNGVETVYAYLSEASVQQGDLVAQGDAIGISEDFLYFEMRENSVAIDPTEKMRL